MNPAAEIVQSVRIASTHPALPGHFPGNPVVPGVVLLDCVAAAIERVRNARLARIDVVKFLAPLRARRRGRTPHRLRRRARQLPHRSRWRGDPAWRRRARMSDAHWSAQPGRRRPFRDLVEALSRIGLLCGRRITRLLLYPITLYFFLRRGSERRVSYAFLERAFGHKARAWQVMRHFHWFSSTMLDRMFLLSDRYARFDVTVHGLEALVSRLQPRSRPAAARCACRQLSEALRVLATERAGCARPRAARHAEDAGALTELLDALNPAVARNVQIDASRPGTEIVHALGEAVREGALVTLLADRAREGESTVVVDFLGAPAPCPTAPFLIGALLKVRRSCCAWACTAAVTVTISTSNRSPTSSCLSAAGARRSFCAVTQRYATRLEH